MRRDSTVIDDAPQAAHSRKQTREERLRALVDAHRFAVTRYVARLGVPSEDREDVLQDVLMVAASKLDSVPVGAERAFLFATAFRIAGNARRGLYRRQRKQDQLVHVRTDPSPSAEDLADQLRARELLDEALEELPSEARPVFLLHEVHEMPLAQIAERLGVPEGTVASRLRRARASFEGWTARRSASAAFAQKRAVTARRTADTERTNPELLSWWVSSGEVDALRALKRIFERAHPSFKLVNVSMPDTSDAREQLVSRISRGAPPDTFLVHGGVDLMNWVRRGVARERMDPLDFLFSSSQWDAVFPRDVLDLVRYEGRFYAVPLDIHRTNGLFFSKRIFEEHGLRPPTTLEQLHEVARELVARRIVPLAIGIRQPWTLTALAFENVLIALAGGEYYREFFAGQRRPTDPELRATLAEVSRILDYANPDADKLGWSAAVDRVRSHTAAMTITGDWAKGYLTAKGWIPDRDFGAMASPGTHGAFVFTTDTFGLPKQASQRAAAIDLLKVLGSQAGQSAFNSLKGSIPARSDMDLTSYDPIARATAKDFLAARRYPSMSALAPRSFMFALDGAMARFAKDRDPDGVIAAIRAHYDLLSPWGALLW